MKPPNTIPVHISEKKSAACYMQRPKASFLLCESETDVVVFTLAKWVHNP